MYPGAHAATHPDKTAYVMATTGQAVTYRELDDEANRLAQLLRDAGLGVGDHIAFCLENHPRFLAVAWGATYAGLYFTAISSRLTTEEAAYIVNDCGAQVFITSAHKRELAADLADQMPEVRTRLMVDGTVDGYEAYEDAIARYPAEPVSADVVEGDPGSRIAGKDMLYSSGTTGRPKGVKPSFPDARLDAPTPVTFLAQMLLGYSDDITYLSPAPQYHAAPLRFTMSVQQVGGLAVIMEHFDPEQFLCLVQEHRVTHTQVVPTMFIRMLKLPDEVRSAYDVSSLQTCVHAAAPCPVAVKEQMIEWWGPVIHEYYAGTEGNGFVYTNSENWLTHKGSVGQALTGIVHIVDEEGEEVGPGEEGTIYFESDAVFEYHNDPEKTAASRLKPGWSTLGDVGRLDDDGFLYLTDRKAYMIITGGVNVYPQEAENVLAMHPKVADVAVIGVPNEDFGEEVKAIVQLAPGEAPSPELEHELPRHPTGKLYKRLLKDEYWAGHDSRII